MNITKLYSCCFIWGTIFLVSCSTITNMNSETHPRSPASNEAAKCTTLVNNLSKNFEWIERVNAFNKVGGAGIYIDAPNVQTETGPLTYFHPNDIGADNGKAIFKLFPRWKANLELNKILKELSDQQVPLFIADTEDVGNLAAVIHRHFPSAKQLLENTGNDKDFIMFLRPSATEDVVVHEARHWLDSNDIDFYSKFYKIFEENKMFLKVKSKAESADNFLSYETGMWEWRGHAEQLKYLRTKKTAAAENEARTTINKYTQVYWLPLRTQLAHLKANNKAAFDTTIKLLKEMEIANVPTELSYKTLFSNI